MSANDSIPFGYCHCGCGRLTTIATSNDKRDETLKGQPKRFITGHNNFVDGKSKFDWLIEAIRNHHDNSCLLWPFTCDESGYGRLRVKRRLVGTHRLAFYLTHGHWPTPEACHSCDTPACFNPRHIFEGTHQKNCEDSARKLRHHKTRLTQEIVAAIRRDYIPRDPHFNMNPLAKKYGVSPKTIWKIVQRQLWKHVP